MYVKDVGELGLYGYASPDPGQATQTRHAFQVMDDDYAAAEFPEYGGDHEKPLKVTAAHEYNHILQYAYDVLQDKWMFESTATWMEEKVFPDIDDYHQYVGPWSQRTTMPITRFDRTNGDKVYGSAIFNRWLDDAYGEDVVRRAWELLDRPGQLRPRRVRPRDPRGHTARGFNYELGDFAASTAGVARGRERHPRGRGVPRRQARRHRPAPPTARS